MPRSPKACRYARGVYTRGASGCGERTEFQIVIKKIDKDFLRLHHWDLLPVLCSQSTTGNERADVGFQIELVLAFVIVHRFDDFHFVRVAIRGETTRHDHILCAFLGTQDHNGALRRILVIPEPSAFGDVTRDLISKLRFAFAATAGQHRVLAARETREPNILDIFGLHFVRIDDVKLAVRLSACQPFPQLIEIVKDSAGNLSFLRVFIFSVPAQECSWVAPQYRSNVSSADKSSPVEDDLANSWGRLRSSNPLGMPADVICSSAGQRSSTGASGGATRQVWLPLTLALCIRSQWSSFLLSIFEAAPLARVVLQPLRPLPNFNM